MIVKREVSVAISHQNVNSLRTCTFSTTVSDKMLFDFAKNVLLKHFNLYPIFVNGIYFEACLVMMLADSSTCYDCESKYLHFTPLVLIRFWLVFFKVTV